MLFSCKWLAEMCPAGNGARAFAEALTSRGLTVDSLTTEGDDHVLDVDIPANRGDCLGHLGLARELAASFGCALVAPARPTPMAPRLEGFAVEIEAPELCTRFTAGIVRDVKVRPSPAWVVKRLEACGLRSINNVVDASNLVMLALGNPVHFYDMSLLRGAKIVARPARAGETLVTLDGIERKLDASMLLIADGERSLGLAGIMGGADTEIRDSTRDVLVEAAWFLPRSVRATARALGMRTDASHRFERGVDPDGTLAAQELSAKLLTELAGGRAEPGGIDTYPSPRVAPRLTLRPAQVERLLGYRPASEEIGRALGAVGLVPEAAADGAFEVTVPSWRFDLEREADLVEEVARHLGYDRIPSVRTEMAVDPVTEGLAPLEERARDLLAARGFHESYGYAMVAAGDDDAFVPPDAPPALALANPIAETLAVLRRSLLPSLVKSVELNLRRGATDVRLFEVEHAFLGRGGHALPREPSRVAVAWSGAGTPPHWSAATRPVDLYDLTGLVEHLLADLAPHVTARRESGEVPGFHPGKSVRWIAETSGAVAWAGELHPTLAGAIGRPLWLAAIELDPLGAVPAPAPFYARLPRLGAVTRDLAVVLPAGTPYGDVEALLAAVPPPVAASFEPVDRYEGPPLAPGEASVTVRVTLQPDERSLTEEEIEGYRQALVAALDGRVRIR